MEIAVVKTTAISRLTTGRTTDGGVAHGDQSSKEWRKERETERKLP